MKRWEKISVGALGFCLAGVLLLLGAAQPNYERNAWSTNVAATPVRGASDLVVSNNGGLISWRFFYGDTNAIARLADILASSNSLFTISTLVSNGTISQIIVLSNNLSSALSNIEVQTNGARVGLGTNINFAAGVTGFVSGSTIVLGIASGGASLSGSTNFVNMSVQAAKLPATNYPGIDGGNQNWELLYYHTNAENAVANLSATWQFVVPPDYATNTGKLHVQHALIATNGPNSSNVVWTVDCVRSHSGDGINIHTAAFGVQVHGTNTWAQSSTIVNAQTDLVINLNTNLMWQAGDLVVMRLTRNTANDTYRNTAVGLVGLQLEYTRQ